MNEKERKKIIKLKKEALACLITNLGENHPETIFTAFELANLYIDIDDYKNAYKHLKNLQFQIKNNKSNVYSVIKDNFDYNFLCTCYFLKKYEEISQNALSFLESISNFEYYDDQMMLIINIIAQSFYRCDKEDLSRSLYQMIIKCVNANLNTFPVPKFVPLTLINYVGFLNSQNEIKEAQALLDSWRDSIDDLIAENCDYDEGDDYQPISEAQIELITNRFLCEYVSGLLDGDIYFEYFEIVNNEVFQNFVNDLLDDNLEEDDLTDKKHLEFPMKF